ncbi:hypothetical protein KSP39_PZI019074 [Platanthera zijinensis]|uniref:CHHC U11-48K-type domain-containing protein n=1 Tax=Platanthera zijinensis TaxID=2320716 RepID=A0AAP0FY45_9ASPA
MDIPCSFSEVSLAQPQHHHSIFHQDSNPTSSDLTATLSLLQDLTILAESTLTSVSDFLFSTPTPFSTSTTLGRCPFDCRHLMPPESLFRHSLTCSSAPGSPLLDLGFLDNLRYPKSLKTEDQLLKENPFVRPFPEAESDICFSLDDELGEIESNFFYKDCPGVVTTTPEPDATGRTFTLPTILFTECANFINDFDSGSGDLDQKAGLLPSDYWALRTEVQSWSNIPSSYSFTALLVAVDLHKADKLGMKRWVILNSPRFGISIDSAMRDHIFLLLKLCLKAVRREAICSLKLVLEVNGFLDSRVVRHECPCLVSSITWLAFQISVLYSEENGKLFVLGMLKESFQLVGRHLTVFMREKGNANCDAKVISSNSECSGGEYKLGLHKSIETMEVKSNKPSESSGRSKIFVSQVASAIASLHERFLLEKRVQALRFSQRLPRFQLYLLLSSSQYLKAVLFISVHLILFCLKMLVYHSLDR